MGSLRPAPGSKRISVLSLLLAEREAAADGLLSFDADVLGYEDLRLEEIECVAEFFQDVYFHLPKAIAGIEVGGSGDEGLPGLFFLQATQEDLRQRLEAIDERILQFQHRVQFAERPPVSEGDPALSKIDEVRIVPDRGLVPGRLELVFYGIFNRCPSVKSVDNIYDSSVFGLTCFEDQVRACTASSRLAALEIERTGVPLRIRPTRPAMTPPGPSSTNSVQSR